MSQNSLTTPTAGTVSGLQLSQNLNAIADTLVTNNSGPSEPAISQAGQWWVDASTTPAVLKMRNTAGTGWTTIGPIDSALFGAIARSGGSMTGALNEARGADIASAATINLTAADGNVVDVTGTIGITAITLAEGAERTVRFLSALTLTNGASLVLPGGANITTAPGDFAVFRGYPSGVVRCTSYSMASGRPVKQQSESYIYLRDEKASGTNGGASVAGAFQTRTLNAEVIDTGNIATLAANQITLAAGTYRVSARAPAILVNGHKIRLRNVTAGVTLITGSTAFSNGGSANPDNTDSVLCGRITVAAGQALELQHYTAAAAGNGLGVACGSGEVEVYSEIEFWKEF